MCELEEYEEQAELDASFRASQRKPKVQKEEKLDKMRPCPFCKSLSLNLITLESSPEEGVGVYLIKQAVVCKCGARGPMVDYVQADQNKAIYAWNNRA